MTSPMPRLLVDAPATTPWRYGLQSAATVLTGDGRWMAGGVEYETDQCYQAHLWDGMACVDPPAVDVTITFTAAVDGDDTVISAAATVPAGSAPRVILIDSTGETGGTVVPITTGASAVPVYTQAPTAAATLTFTITDQATGVTDDHDVTVDATGAITAGGTATLADVPALKIFGEDNTIVGGDAFTVYSEMGCRTVGMLDSVRARVQARLIAGEVVAMERRVLEKVIAPGAADVTGDLTGVNLIRGLGTLEAYVASVYSGVATFHAPRWLAPYLADRSQIVRDGNVLRTPLDSIWAFGGGYTPNITPAGAPTAAGKVWIYATGQVVIRRSEIDFPASSARDGGVNLAQNRINVLAERTYSVTVDCLRVGVQIDLDKPTLTVTVAA